MKSLGGFFIRRKLDKRNGKKDMVYRSILHIVSLHSWYVHVWKHKQLYVCIQYLVWNSFHYFYSTLRNCSGMDKAWNFFWREVGADRENLCLLKLAFCQLLKKLCAVVRKDYLIYLKLLKMWYLYTLSCTFIWKHLFFKILSHIYMYNVHL